MLRPIPNGYYVSSQCLFCTSRKCNKAIYTKDLSFLEIACGSHSKDLEEYADLMLKGRIRTHVSSSSHLSRAKIRKEHTFKCLRFVADILESSIEPHLQKQYQAQFDKIRIPFQFSN